MSIIYGKSLRVKKGTPGGKIDNLYLYLVMRIRKLHIEYGIPTNGIPFTESPFLAFIDKTEVFHAALPFSSNH